MQQLGGENRSIHNRNKKGAATFPARAEASLTSLKKQQQDQPEEDQGQKQGQKTAEPQKRQQQHQQKRAAAA
jgi:hypothetical protein